MRFLQFYRLVLPAALVLCGSADAAPLRAVQSGTTTLAAGASSVAVTITAVDPAKSFLVFGIEGSDNSPDDLQISGQITNATTLTFERTGTTTSVVLTWYVAEFHLGVAVQRGTTTIPVGPNPADVDVPLTSAVDLSKSFPIVTFRTGGVDFDSSDFVRAKIIEDGTNGTCTPAASHCLRLYAPDGSPGTVEWQVVEYQDANVQTGDVTFDSTSGQLSVNAAITSVDTAKSWLVYSYECAPAFCNGNVANIGSRMISGEVTSATNLRFDRDVASLVGEEINVTWYLVEFTDATTVQHGSQLFNVGNASRNVNITSVKPAATIATGGGYMRGGRTPYAADDDPGIGWFRMELTSPTRLQIRRGRTGDASTVGWFVVEFDHPRTPSGHRLVYGTNDGPADTPRARMWQTSTDSLSPELLTHLANTDIRYVVSAQSPVADEEIVVVMSDAPSIDALRWNVNGWTPEWASATLTVPNTERRGIAVAYEQTSGNALVVYVDNSNNLLYRTWDGALWGAETSVFATPPGTGVAQWVELAADPTSDRIALVYSDALSDVHAVIWDGTAWLEAATELTLSTTGSTFREYRDVDLAYEASGDLLVAFARTDGFDHYTMASGTTTWVNGGHTTVVGGNVAYIGMAVEPLGNRMALTALDQDAGVERLGAAIWNGTAWQDVGELVNDVPHWENDPDGPFYAAAGWVGTSGKAVVTWSDFTAGELGWASWNGGPGWVVEPDEVVGAATNHLRSFHVESFEDENKVVAVFSDKDGNLASGVYDGASWQFQGLSTDVSNALYKPFSFSLSFAGVTAVELASFEARGLDGAIELSWTTGSEIDNLGFHLYRSEQADGPYERVTTSLVPGLGSSPEGASYRYIDQGLDNGSSYFYELEDVETDGDTKRHGPVSAVPDATALGSSGGTSIRYGEPEGHRITMDRGRGHHLVVDLYTPGLAATPLEDGTLAIAIPGFAEAEDGLPVKRHWIDAIVGRRVEIVSVRARDVVATSLRPSGSSLEVVANGDGGVSLTRVTRRKLDREFGESARVVTVGFQGEHKRALLELSPLHWDPDLQKLVLARHLRVVVSLRSRDPHERVTPDGGRRELARRRQGRVLQRLVATQPGLYRVRQPTGGNLRRELRLSRGGESVPAYRDGPWLYFWSPGGAGNPYGHASVYEISTGDPGPSLSLSTDVPEGFVYRDTVHREEDRLYGSSFVRAEKPWFWEHLFAPASSTLPFEVTNPTDEGSEPTLRVHLFGGKRFSDRRGSPRPPLGQRQPRPRDSLER